MLEPSTVFKLVGTGLAAVGFLLFVGFGIGSNASAPGYAAVYLDDEAKTYIALPCIGEWERRPGEKFAAVRLGKLSEARQLAYEPDAICRESGAFAPHDRSLTGHLLVKLGVLSPIQHWWEAPYRTEEGKVVYPNR